jgi:hypothetical protein
MQGAKRVYVVYTISVDEFDGLVAAFWSEEEAQQEADRLKSRATEYRHFYVESTEIR